MNRKTSKSQKKKGKTLEWIKQKKDKMLKAGKSVKSDSKFTGRKRPVAF